MEEVWGSDIEWIIATQNEALHHDFNVNLDNNISLGNSDLKVIIAQFDWTQNYSFELNDIISTTINYLLFW